MMYDEKVIMSASSETKNTSNTSEVKHIDEHYQEVIDKIMYEYFEDESNVVDSENENEGDANEEMLREEKSIEKGASKSSYPIPTKSTNGTLRRAESKDIETQTDPPLCSVREEISNTINPGKQNEGDQAQYSHRYDKSGEFRYENVHFFKYNDIAKEYFHKLHQYHIGYTTPVDSRNRMLIEIRSLGVDRLNICLFGSPGCGKSALLNTMYAVVTSQYFEHSLERKLGKRYRECVTHKRLELRLTENISVLDNQGLTFSKASLNEVKKQCEGLREAEEPISPEWKSSISRKGRDVLKLCNKRMLLRDRVHCPVVVSSITQELDKNAMKHLVLTIKQTCFCDPIVVILTNIHDSESTKTYMTKSRKTYFESIGCKSVFELNSYTSSNHKYNIETEEKVLNILYECCLVGDKAIATTLQNYKKTACC